MVHFLKKNIIISTFFRVNQVLPSKYKKRGLFVLLLLCFNSILELLGLGVFLPLFAVILEEGAVMKYDILNYFFVLWGGTEKSFVLLLIGFVLFIIIFKNIISLVISNYQAKYSYDVNKDFAIRNFKGVLNGDIQNLKDSNSNDVVRDINAVPQYFSNHILLPLISLINELLILSFIVLGLFSFNYKVLVLLCLVIVPTFTLFYLIVKGKIKKIADGIHVMQPKLVKVLYQSIFGFVDVKMTNSDDYFVRDYSNSQKEYVKLLRKKYVYNLAPTKVIESSMMLGVLVIVVYGVFYFNSRSELITLLGLFALAAYRILPSINRMMIALMSIKSHQYTIDYYKKTLDDLPDFKSQLLGAKMKFQNEISVNNLSFSYSADQEDVLHDVSFKIQKGEKVGLIGRSGSGKTTLINTLLYFFKPSSGNVEIDGVELCDENVRNWRNIIGYVQQDVFILDGTVASNIAFGIPEKDIDFDKINEVIKKSKLEDVIEKFKDGVNTRIGERGAKLSGGQKQRLGVARALYFGAEILIFDEATSALDSETEREITESINELSNYNLTMIVIAHRITTLKYCDKIIELKNGEIDALKSYEEILLDL